MTRWGVVLLLSFYLVIPFVAASQDKLTNQQRFEKLARKLHLKTPKLSEDEYEIRIWNRQGLTFGDAQMLYVLTKKKKALSVAKYVINFDKDGFISAIDLKPPNPVTIDLWELLVNHHILELPDQKAIHDELHPQHKDSTWTGVEADGSVSIHAKKLESSVWITDGESYYFEVFSEKDYRSYGYSNPREYIRYKPNIAELQNVVAILNSMATLFRPSSKI